MSITPLEVTGIHSISSPCDCRIRAGSTTLGCSIRDNITCPLDPESPRIAMLFASVPPLVNTSRSVFAGSSDPPSDRPRSPRASSSTCRPRRPPACCLAAVMSPHWPPGRWRLFGHRGGAGCHGGRRTGNRLLCDGCGAEPRVLCEPPRDRGGVGDPRSASRQQPDHRRRRSWRQLAAQRDLGSFFPSSRLIISSLYSRQPILFDAPSHRHLLVCDH